MSFPFRRLLPLLFLLLAGCVAAPRPAATVGEPQTARALLMARAEAGPVPLVIRGTLRNLSAEQMAKAAARGVRALDVRFRPQPEPPPADSYLLLVLREAGKPLPREVCRSADALAGNVAETVVAAWCEEGRTVAAVEVPSGEPAAAAVTRAIWRAMAALFPDNYADTYGFDLFGQRITIGGTFGF